MRASQFVDRFFFDGWCRKTGFVTLLIALTLTLVWIHSQAFSFGLLINFKDQTMWEFTSSQCGLACVSELPDTLIEFAPFCPPLWSPRDDNSVAALDVGKEAQTQFEFLGLGSASIENPIQESQAWKKRRPKRIGVWVIPHWAVVLPLAGLSVYLLSKPTKPSQAGPPGTPTD